MYRNIVLKFACRECCLPVSLADRLPLLERSSKAYCEIHWRTHTFLVSLPVLRLGRLPRCF